MGHYCKICGKNQSNEKFSGKGHRSHICKVCSRKPENEINEIKISNEIIGYLGQSNISKNNIKRLNELTTCQNDNIIEMAEIVLEVAKVKPYKKRRLKFLAKERPDLLETIKETGLIYAHYL